ncbi:MAG: helix-turn-helix transcriptional regulator, partial [Firmicutes bacterium]|nr:helix-turn-helix transcriptional regulator [Bacillota bacterium]
MGTVNIRIRELRTALGMTQDSLAKRLGVDRTTISKWEKEDGAEPDSGTIVSLSHIFGVSTDYLLGRTDDP